MRNYGIKWTNGWEVINFTINDNSYHGFIKVTKKGEITIECRKDVDCRPLDKVIVDSYQNLIVQKILITTSRAELHCIKDDKENLKSQYKQRKTKKSTRR